MPGLTKITRVWWRPGTGSAWSTSITYILSHLPKPVTFTVWIKGDAD